MMRSAPGVELFNMKASSSNGRAADSKSVGWGFKSLLACIHLKRSRELSERAVNQEAR